MKTKTTGKTKKSYWLPPATIALLEAKRDADINGQQRSMTQFLIEAIHLAYGAARATATRNDLDWRARESRGNGPTSSK